MLTKEQLLDIGNTILNSSKSDVVSVQISYANKAVTRIANNRVLASDNGESIDVAIKTQKGGKLPAGISFNMVDGASLKAAIRMVDELARTYIGSPNAFTRVPDGPQQYMPVSLWHDSTVAAMSTVNESVVPPLIQSLKNSPFKGSGFIGLVARSTTVMQKDGLVAFSQETDSEVIVSARSADGKAAGWHGQAARDWSKIDPGAVAAKALDMTKRSMNPYAVEPGRRVAILSPFAVAQVLRHIPSQFDAFITDEASSTVFSVRGNPNKKNKIGLRVLDPNLSISSDPADPEGGYTPFGDMPAEGKALPTRAKTYVENGILKDLAYGIDYSLRRGKAFTQLPWSVRLEARAGAPVKTIEEMISSCQEGIYINRFSDVNLVDLLTCMQTGVTRDGCFLVKNGKIDRPAKNFRFTDSPFFFLNRVLAIGKSERVALGYVASGDEPGYATEWPRRPMIVPPVMVGDFNLTALSDAV